MTITDAQLVARAQQGDRAAFEELVRTHAPRLHVIILRLLDEPAAAEDVTQETFIRAWRSIGDFRGEAEFFTWLYRIGVNEARRRHSQRTRGVLRHLRSLDSGALEVPDLSAAPQLLAEQAELRRALELAVRSLSPSYRTPLILRDVEGLSTAQAAAICELSEPAFKSRLHRARMAVRAGIADYLDQT